MKILVVEDDFTSRLLMQELLKEYGTVHIAVTGKEAVEAAAAALTAGEPYDLICLDIMLPEMDGQAVLQEIRAKEEAQGKDAAKRSKIVMTTALNDYKSTSKAYRSLCDGYLVKPIEKTALLNEMKELGLLSG